MNSEKFASILGAIVAVVVLVAAFFYGPLGKPLKPDQKAEPAAQPVVPPPPAVRGPVVREVPK
jgi:hypothetical protein